ncbi:ABC transporter ATP-binding protein [Legionella bononiensis]|uniref:ABC transporter ATP-binding protein n=1 Tax=Legionella bononiensis TaxID=2793102 RepID=A0ABS1W6F8_9GAMM|nr:ABC transporter ATP-binding protein [Legionella bononiensis]MBL7478355.1 ABC transporter ATP-binding protein [Legionella bononiensis]MBL7524952.1 ABC transporter ATP-binding protein [Legionella bononiensis]MBL7561249.1 ABC transporter ATP-binding protein [Legionella bononiensis]
MSASDSNIIIDVKGLRKSFGQRVVVNNIDLMVEKGEVFGFLGPNGSGKTTTIRMICGLLKADAGQGTCLGFDILTQSDQIKERVGYMTQKFSLYTELSIEENLIFIARVYGIANRNKRVAESLDKLGLTDRRKQLTGELSGGWKQRVALATCLIHDPDLLLLDEPTAGVDPIARREFWDQIHFLSQEGITTFVSTHYMDEAERCTRIAYLAYGKLLTTGTVSEVIDETHLKTWEIKGNVTTSLLQHAKKIPGVVQSALFGNLIHVCGYNTELIEEGLKQLSTHYSIQWCSIQPTLEDAFISLVNKSPEPFVD